MAFRRIAQIQQPQAPLAANDSITPAAINPPPRRRAVAEPPREVAAVPSEASSGRQEEPASKDYIVGKNRPPVHSRWKKGQSGNPKGRPKGSRNYDTMTLAVFAEKMSVKTANGEQKMDTFELALNKVREKVGRGDMKAIGLALDEARRLLQPPAPEPVATDRVAALTPAELQIVADLLGEHGLEPMVIGKPNFVEADVAGAIAADGEGGDADEGADDYDDDADGDRDDREWED